MIANHTQFTTAIQDRKKVCVRFYSQPDSGVLDHVCAPMDYGPGSEADGLNRYWFWDYANETGAKAIGLMPQQILDLQVLGEGFDPSEFRLGSQPEPRTVAAAPAPPVLSANDQNKTPIL